MTSPFSIALSMMGATRFAAQPMTSADAGPELEAVLIEHCRADLAHFKCPRSIDFTDNLPRDPSGKLFKRPLKDRYWPSVDGSISQKQSPIPPQEPGENRGQYTYFLHPAG